LIKTIFKRNKIGVMKHASSQATFSFGNEQMPPIDLESVGSILGISTATARNWIKSGHLIKSKGNGQITFDARHIDEVKRKLTTGEFGRLQKRANKKSSRSTFIPEEYAATKQVTLTVTELVCRYRKEGYELRPFLLSVILGLLQDHVNRTSIREELKWWFRGINGELPNLEVELPRGQLDFLGLLYQSLLAEGKKAEAGSYYTPSEVAFSMIAEHTKPVSTFLDPCCGTGLFLLQASEIISDPEHISGYDMDEIAVHIARLNLLLKFPNHEFTPKIYHRCGLLDPDPKFDVVATNPPWGAHFSTEELAQLQNLYRLESNESFSFFIKAGLRNLKPNGVLSILLPESFLNIRTHREVRGIILKDTCIHSVSNLGRIFKNVFTPVVRLDVKKTPPTKEHSFVVHSGGVDRFISQRRLAANSDHVFDILSNDEDREILDLLYSCAHVTLHENAEWALGIVTGNNALFLSDSKTSDAEPIWTGKELRRFVAQAPTRYIYFQPEKFQQVAPVANYRAPEKLLYRFICNELVFSYDDRQTLALNSANILLPHLPGYSIKSTLAFLNSRVFQFIFQRKFKALKVLRGDLERLPFPDISKTVESTITQHVEVMLDEAENHQTKKNCYAELDEMVMDAFGLNDNQKAHIQNAVKLSPRFFPFQTNC